MDYSEQYKHPEWQRKRLRILERDNFKCCACGDSKKTLHVHHFYYIKGNNIWEYPNKHLKTLCEECHKFYHEQILELQKAFAELDTCDLLAIILNTDKESFIKNFQKEIDIEHQSMREY